MIENETHFLLHCPLYAEERMILIEYIHKNVECDHFYFLTDDEKLIVMMSENVVKCTAKFLYDSYFKRRGLIYK